MTIEDIRTNHEAMSLEQLEGEIRSRDVSVQGLRAEMLEIRQRLEPHILRKQRADLLAGAGKQSIELTPSVKLGGM